MGQDTDEALAAVKRGDLGNTSQDLAEHSEKPSRFGRRSVIPVAPFLLLLGVALYDQHTSRGLFAGLYSAMALFFCGPLLVLCGWTFALVGRFHDQKKQLANVMLAFWTLAVLSVFLLK